MAFGSQAINVKSKKMYRNDSCHRQSCRWEMSISYIFSCLSLAKRLSLNYRVRISSTSVLRMKSIGRVNAFNGFNIDPSSGYIRCEVYTDQLNFPKRILPTKFYQNFQGTLQAVAWPEVRDVDM